MASPSTTSRGKGSERLLILEDAPGSMKGPQYTLKCHGEGMDVATGTLNALLRRFNIEKKNFFD